LNGQFQLADLIAHCRFTGRIGNLAPIGTT